MERGLIKMSKWVYEGVGWVVKIEMDKVEEKSKGGIIITPSQKDWQRYIKTGTVVQMGELCYTHPKFEGKPRCKIGDKVMVPVEKGYGIMESGIEYKFLLDSEIDMVGREVEDDFNYEYSKREIAKERDL